MTCFITNLLNFDVNLPLYVKQSKLMFQDLAQDPHHEASLKISGFSLVRRSPRAVLELHHSFFLSQVSSSLTLFTARREV